MIRPWVSECPLCRRRSWVILAIQCIVTLLEALVAKMLKLAFAVAALP